MKIVVSPAKSLDYERSFDTPDVSIPTFLKEADQLAKKLAKFSPKKLADLMHLSPALADLNVERYSNWVAPTKLSENVKPSATVFTGEVYKGLEVETFTNENWKVAQEKLRILSGLYGILKPLDLMYPYRLEMGTKWQVTPKVKNLYEFWGDKVAKALLSEMKEGEVLVNLASNEYFKVIAKHLKNITVITPVFKEFKNGDYKVVMMYAKHARGAMARDIITQNYSSHEDLKGYNVDGYTFNEQLSSEKEWVFVR